MAEPDLAAPAAATAMPPPETIKDWLDNNQDKAGTADYVTMKQAFDAAASPPANTSGPRVQPAVAPTQITVTPSAAQSNAALPGPRVGKDPRLMEPVAPSINYGAPIEEVRTALAGVQNEPSRAAGWNRWADFQEQQQHAQGGLLRGANDWMRAVAQGVPGGAWGDEANAAVHSILPGFAGGMPYEEKLALERARNRRFAYEHPVGNVAANIGGAVASAPLTTIRGAGVLANTGIDTVIAAIQGAGGADQNQDRLKAGAIDAGITAPLSLGLNTLIKNLGRYGITSENVVRAAEALGIDRLIPAFVKAASPDIQAAGRRTAQGSLGGSLNQSWRGAEDAVEQSAAGTANRAAGSTDVQLAPHTAGTTVTPSLETAIDAAQTQKGELARESRDLLPPAVRYDVPQMREATEQVIERRAGMGAENPQAGLGDQLGMTTRPPPDPMRGPFSHYGPGGSTWENMADQATEIGQRLGLPPTIPRAVDDAQLAQIYAGLRGDQRSIMRRDAGPWGEAIFTRNLEQSSNLSDVQRAISDAMKDRPEAVVNMIHSAATAKGAGTDINALNTVIGALPMQERVALGGGVLGKIVNDAGGSSAKMASALELIPDSAKALLFPPGTRLSRDVEALREVMGRVGEVNALQSTGSAASLGQTMAIAGKYGGLGLGAGAALYGADQAGYGGAAAALGTGALGAKYGFNRFAKPYLLQHGITPAVQQGMDAARGIPRGVGSLYQPPPSEPQ